MRNYFTFHLQLQFASYKMALQQARERLVGSTKAAVVSAAIA
jgi:hypothetical protein